MPDIQWVPLFWKTMDLGWLPVLEYLGKTYECVVLRRSRTLHFDPFLLSNISNHNHKEGEHHKTLWFPYFTMENPTKMHDLGVALWLRKPPYIFNILQPASSSMFQVIARASWPSTRRVHCPSPRYWRSLLSFPCHMWVSINGLPQ